ncbi:hypothetical protein [Actinoplanes sp. NBRC 103695]|uniref:hypothetical protein n=1 Tax=Actinoplanes sp. NBRC 103695 TaxID=3032202 RepID=UPI002554F193|nr:hypothetical protein [Actinoplanes sp. NBRC 103695]
MDFGQADVPVACDTCAEGHTGVVYETIIGGRLQWVLDYECEGSPIEAFGWDRSPDEYRQAILDQSGTFRLDVPDAGGSRVAVLKALRDGGVAWVDVAGGLDALLDEGIVGTCAELSLLATRLESAGATVAVVRRADAAGG